MAQFSTVRYGSRFPTFQSDNLNSNLARSGRTRPSYRNSPGQGPYSLASLMGAQTPKPYTPAYPSFTAPAAAPKPPVSSAPAFKPPVDLSSDPILQAIRATGDRNVADARTGAQTSAEQSLIQYGASSVPQSLKDLYAGDTSNPIYAALNDSNTAAAAAANPDSWLKQLSAAHGKNIAGIDTTDNAANIYYDSQHANDLADEATQYRQGQSSAAQTLGQMLNQAYGEVLDAQNQASSDYNSGLSDAYIRWLQSQPPGGGDTPPPDAPGVLNNESSGETLYYNSATGQWQRGIPQTGGRVGY